MALASQNVVAPSGSSLSPDLAFLMDDKGIESAVQQKVLGLGVASVNHFALLADYRGGLSKFLKDCLGMSMTQMLPQRRDLPGVCLT